MGRSLIFVDSAMQAVLAAHGLRGYEDFADCRDGEVVSRSGTTLTRRLTLHQGEVTHVLFLKRYAYDGPRWRHRFRTPKSAVEARNYCILRERCGAGTPDVIAHGAEKLGLRLRSAFLLTRGVPDSTTLEAFAADAGGRLSRVARVSLIEAVADLARRMHAVQFYHADLQWRNILLQTDGGVGSKRQWSMPVRLFVIDSSRGGLRRTRAGRRHGRIRDLSSLDKLARLCLTRTERLRFLRAYMNPAAIRDPEARQLINEVQAYSELKAR